MSPAKAVPPDTRSAKMRDQLREILSPVVAEAGFDLEELTVKSVGRRSLIRIVVDGDGGIDLDSVATVSRLLSDTLDRNGSAGDQFAEPFVLEVTSPGVDRPLTQPRHWRRAVGRLVKVDFHGVALTGRITSTTDEGVVLAIESIDRNLVDQELAWSDLGPGRVQIEFNRPTGLDDTDDTDTDDTGLDTDTDTDDTDDTDDETAEGTEED